MHPTETADGEYPNRVPKDVVVSVEMITYNHAAYIAQAIESVLMQKTDFPFELVIGEDRSTDGTREICIKYAQQHPDKIRLFLRSEADKQEGSKYPAGRYNGYLVRRACRGEFVAILEGDDFWLDPLKLQRQVDHMRAHPADNICATRALMWHFDGGPGSRLNPNTILTRMEFRDLLGGSGGVVNTCTFLYRRNAIKDPATWSMGIVSGDWALLVTALEDGSCCEVLPAVTAVYRIQKGGAWNRHVWTREKYNQSTLAGLEAYARVMPRHRAQAINRRLAYYRLTLGLCRARRLRRPWVLLHGLACHPAVAMDVVDSLRYQMLRKLFGLERLMNIRRRRFLRTTLQ